MFKYKRLVCIIGIFLTIFSVFAQNNNLVLKVDKDKKSYIKLDQNSQSFIDSAYIQFLRDLMVLPSITVRTSDIDAELREIQKKSQIEAATGLGSDASAYAADKGSRAELLVLFSLSNQINGNYQIICTVSEIESMRIVVTESTEKMPVTKLSEDIVIDELAYRTLSSLQKRGYIAIIPVNVTNQLLHRENTEASLLKYIEEYSQQREAAERELAAIQKQIKTEKDRLDAESQTLALQFKIEMSEKNKSIAEENLRRQKIESEKNQKRQQEMEQMQQSQRDKFLKDVQAIEEARIAIRKKSLESLPFQKRIDLIESSKITIKRLEKQLSDSLNQNYSYYEEKMNTEITDIKAEPWRKADLSNGVPTQQAKDFRNKKIEEIKNKYITQRLEAESQLREAAKPIIDSYKTQLNVNIREMEKTTYVFRSIDSTDDFLSLEVSEFDGNRKVWDVKSNFTISSLVYSGITVISDVNLPSTNISYEKMTGEMPDIQTVSGYQKYQDMVDMADLYFRTSVPYLYSEISVKVRYYENGYKITPTGFKIFKTQNNETPIFLYSEMDFKKDVEKIKYVSEMKSNITTYKVNPQNNKDKKSYKKTKRSYYVYPEGKKGVFLDLGYFNGAFFHGMDADLSCFLISGDYFSFGADVGIMLPQLKEHYYIDYSGKCYFVYSNLDVCFSLTFGSFKPYLVTGVGGYYLSMSNNTANNFIFGNTFSTRIGFDYYFDTFSIGLLYKFSYLYGSGFNDTYSASIGLHW